MNEAYGTGIGKMMKVYEDEEDKPEGPGIPYRNKDKKSYLMVSMSADMSA